MTKEPGLVVADKKQRKAAREKGGPPAPLAK
jgi:hypothetical protein